MSSEAAGKARYATSRVIAEHYGRTQRSVQTWLRDVERVHGPVRRSQRGPVDIERMREIDPKFLRECSLTAPGSDDVDARLDRHGESIADLKRQVRNLERDTRALAKALAWFERNGGTP